MTGAVGCRNDRAKQDNLPRPVTVNISLLNASSNPVDRVKLVWSGPDVPGGILSPGVSKTTVGAEWPNIANAKLTFVDDKTRKPYSFEVSFSAVNQQVLSGKCSDVTIRILDYENGDVVCEKP